ncbi:MAG: hypothetical protein ACFFEY_16645 [Candidatus Thorarchaeota archaeon]
MEKKIEKGNLEEVIAVFKTMLENIDNVKPYYSIAFYTPENAELFRKKIIDLYREIPDEEETKSVENPYYGGMMILPIRLILDYIYPIEKTKWKD